jgi:hypothetical protein
VQRKEIKAMAGDVNFKGCVKEEIRLAENRHSFYT